MRRNLGLFYFGISLVVALGAGAAMWGHRQAGALQTQVLGHRNAVEDAHRLILAVSDADSAFRGYLLYEQPSYVETVFRTLTQIEGRRSAAIIATIDAEMGGASLRSAVDAWVAQRSRAHALIAQGERDRVMEAGRLGRGLALTNEVKDRVHAFLDQRLQRVEALNIRRDRAGQVSTALVAGSALLSLMGLGLAFSQLRRQRGAETAALGGLARSSEEMTSLLRISDMLQACEGTEDVTAVVARAAGSLLPDNPGTLYLLKDGGTDELRRAGHWGGALPPLAEELAAGGCWATKRGRIQNCDKDTPCEGRSCEGHALCLPLSARGESLGMLRVQGLRRGEATAQLATALADGISLSLANIGLREKLRAQALRDTLTGLYNRRFLEEVGEKMALQVQRRQGHLAVLMLDIDHFKALNDTHGHAAGDAALRLMGQMLQEGLRRSDIACRYGGEEFVLLLPDCPGQAALERAEGLVRRIEQQSGTRGAPACTVSIGVAAMPDNAGSLADAMRAADEALYVAKGSGRNRAVLAAPRMAAPALRLASSQDEAQAAALSA